jgi:lipoprotein-anchoring transpeptidase ErfK/SrfK
MLKMKFKVLLPAIAAAVILIMIVIVFISKAPSGSNEGAILSGAKTFENEAKTDEAIKEYERVIAEYPQSKTAGQAYISLAALYEKQGKLIDARDAYRKAFEAYPDMDIVRNAKGKIEDLNIKIIFSPLIDSASRVYEVRAGDSLGKIAKASGTTVELLKKSNNLTNDIIREGMRLKTVTAKFSIIVDKSQNVLFLKEDENIIKAYKVSTGANNSTPVGNFKIENKLVDPVWYSSNAVVPAGSPENILGTRWLGISVPGYGIHGTTDPVSLGKQVTAGCVRMRNADVEELYMIVPIGTEVTIMD